MGREGLRGRGNWQNNSGMNAGQAEKRFHVVFDEAFRGTPFSIQAKPREFSHLYVDVVLPRSVLQQIYCPPGGIKKHGLAPDYAIRNADTGKTLYVEVKRQDGWIESNTRSAGRGNVHERSNKYFTPGLLKALREKGGLGEEVLPFWTVFQGDITRDPCRVREITLWYDNYDAHFFMWRNTADPKPLLDHFNKRLRTLLL